VISVSSVVNGRKYFDRMNRIFRMALVDSVDSVQSSVISVSSVVKQTVRWLWRGKTDLDPRA
jgi:hypothetical protein